MKIKFDKDLFAALGLAAGAGIIITAGLALLAWLSWGVVFILATAAMVPLAQGAITLWKEKNCVDVADFIQELIDELNEDDDTDTNNNNRIC